MACDARTYPFIGRHEGKVLRAYRCPAGVITIGYGFTMGSKVFAAFWASKAGRALRLGDVITSAEAERLLKTVVDREYLEAVEKGAPEAAANEKGAAASLLYNCGLGAARWKWFAALARGDARLAGALMRTTATTARGRRLPGLVRRRAEEADIMALNRWPAWMKREPGAAGLEADDLEQGLKWLETLGFLKVRHVNDNPAMNRLAPGPDAIRAAVLAFQSQHKQLTADGILGRATLDQLQRVTDLKAKSKSVTAGGGAAAGAGAADKAAEAGGVASSGWGEVLVAGGMLLLIAGLLYLAFRYRDELKIALTRRSA